MEQPLLRLLIQEKLADGRLPHTPIARAWNGAGNGRMCDGCGETVTNTGGIEVLGLGAVTLDQLMGRHRCAELELSFECSLDD